MSIQLRFVLADNLPASIIAWFSAGHFSHVDYVMPDGQLLGSRADRIGGKPSGVQIRPFGYEVVKRAVILELAASEIQMLRFQNFLNAQIGKPYDRTSILGFVFNRDWRAKNSWFCSELMAAALEISGLVRPLYFPPNKVTPAALAEFLSALGATWNELPDPSLN